MKCDDIIRELDDLKPNKYTAAQKVQWLYDLDRRIYDSIVSNREEPAEDITPYTNVYAELLMGDNARRMYLFYLMSQVDMYQQEFDLYQNDAALFNLEYTEVIAQYNRTHLPAAKRWVNI